MSAPVFAISPTTQQYDWGKLGLSSKVAQFATSSGIAGFRLEETTPYAELWMGTHPKSPSHVVPSGEVLAEHIASRPELMGRKVIDTFEASDGNIPFLFKVLAIQKALSIQTHPDKETAKKLHAEQPDIYKDPNHKPEMALAITPFSALCGFLPLPIIASHLSQSPEFSSLIPPNIIASFTTIASSSNPTGPTEKTALKDVFAALMTAEESQCKSAITELVQRLKSGRVTDAEKTHGLDTLIPSLEADFPGDIGIFCPYMLNYVHLSPGEAIFLGAGEPHAYVTGDIIECMATSDNVIRAGLTPKLRDVPNLISGLTYEASPPSKHVVKSTAFSRAERGKTTLYDPPIPEFSVLQVKLGGGEDEVHKPLDGPSITIVTEGKGWVSWSPDGRLDLVAGMVFFAGAGTEIQFSATDSGLVVYRAFVEVA